MLSIHARIREWFIGMCFSLPCEFHATGEWIN